MIWQMLCSSFLAHICVYVKYVGSLSVGGLLGDWSFALGKLFK